MDAHRWHREKPYRNRLVRDDGLSPDYAREAAAEAGYLKPDSVIDDLYQALDRDLRGQRVYSEQDMTEVLTRESEAAGRVDRAELEEYAHRLNLPPEVVARMDDAGLANAITYEQAARGLAEGGAQAVLPGVERISDRALAERRMQQTLRPHAAQKPIDEGLFDVQGRGQMESPEAA